MSQRIFYCDGACSTNGTWSGGYGVVELSTAYSQTMDDYTPRYSIEFYKSETFEKTTNNKMELIAMIEALKQIHKYIKSGEKYIDYIVCSDSAYVCNILLSWGPTWVRNNWTKSNNQPILNLELIQEMYNLYIKYKDKISIQKIKGHSNILGNELADSLATNDLKIFRYLLEKNNVAYDILCYCPICDKEQLTTIYGNKGHCPVCGHHLNPDNI